MADKLLVGSLVISLSWCNLMPIWLSVMVILRDVFLIIAGFVIRYISLPPPVSKIAFHFKIPFYLKHRNDDQVIICFCSER